MIQFRRPPPVVLVTSCEHTRFVLDQSISTIFQFHIILDLSDYLRHLIIHQGIINIMDTKHLTIWVTLEGMGTTGFSTNPLKFPRNPETVDLGCAEMALLTKLNGKTHLSTVRFFEIEIRNPHGVDVKNERNNNKCR